ncbi:MAG: hypothetical protein WA919_11105 [Coleofasciculaceae cyanobacterium]
MGRLLSISEAAKLKGVSQNTASAVGKTGETHSPFSARLYGSRSHKNKKLVEELRGVAQKI